MKNVREYLEKAYAEAMYDEMYVTAGLIAAALDTVGISVSADSVEEDLPDYESKNVVSFPRGQKK